MADDLPTKRDQKPWQAMQQKQTEGHGFFRGARSNQPKPRAGREQTAQGGSGERAIDHAAFLDMLEARKATYKQAGVAYYRPWVFLITDGGPTDYWQAAAERVRLGDSPERKTFSFFAVGVEGADMGKLAAICSPQRPPMKLKGLSFRELFSWLSSSLGGVAKFQPGQMVALPLPTGWSAVG